MANKIEKLSKFLEQSEIKELKIKNPEKFKKLSEKIHLIGETQEKITELKNELNGTLDSKVDKLLGYIDTAEKNQNPLDAAKQKVEDVVKEKKDIFLKDLKEKADKKIPFIGGSLFDWALDLMKPIDKEKASFSDKIFGKIGASIGLFILGLLGLKKGYEKLNGIKEEEEEGKNKEDTSEDVENTEIEVDNLETLQKGILIKSGFNILKGFSGVEFKKNNASKNIFNNLKNKKQSEIQEKLNSCIDSSGKAMASKVKELQGLYGIDTKYSGEEIFNVLSTLSNRYINIIYSQRLSKDNLQKILLGKNGKIKDNYKEFLSDSEIELLEKGNLDYRLLDISTISILISLSFTSFLIYGVDKLKKIGIEAFNYITEESDLQEQIKTEIERRKKNLLPIKILDSFPDGSKEMSFGISELLENKNYKTLSDFEKGNVNKFIRFKDNLLNFIKNNNEIKFGVENFDIGFNESINFTKIIGLYTLLDGEMDFDKLIDGNSNYDSLKKSSFILWLGDAIGEISPKIEVEYNAAIINDITNDVKSDIFSENDKLLFASLSANIGGKYIDYIERKVVQIDGVILETISTLFQKIGLSKNISDALTRALEIGGILLFFKTFKKLNIISKFLIGGTVFLPVIALLVKEFGISEIKRQVGNEMYKELEGLVEGDLTVNGKTAPVRSLENIVEFQKNPDKYLEKANKVDKLISNDVEIEVNMHSGVKVSYKGNKYELDIGPVLFENDEKIDEHNGKNIRIKNASIEDNNIIIVGTGDRTIEVSKELIVEKVKEGKLQEKFNDTYIILIKSNFKKDERENPISYFNNLVPEFAEDNVILRKI